MRNSARLGAVIFLLASTVLLNAAEATFDWATRVDGVGEPRAVFAADQTGNLFLAGNIVGGSAWYRPSIVTKLDSQGTVLWTRTLNSSTVLSLATDLAGACYASGYALADSFATAGVVPTGSGSAFVAKFSPAGDLKWVRLEGGPQTVIVVDHTAMDKMDNLSVNLVKVDRSDNLYLAGSYWQNVTIGGTALPPTSSGLDRGTFLAKFSKDGALQWVRTEDADILRDEIALDATGNILVSAEHVTSDGQARIQEGFLTKYDKDGTVLWSRPTVSSSRFSSLAIDQEGNAFVLAFPWVDVAYALDLSKWSPSGEQLWERQYQPAPPDSYFWHNGGIAVDKQGNCFVSGTYSGAPVFDNLVLGTTAAYDSFVFKYTPSGKLRWGVSSQGLRPEINRNAGDASWAYATRLAIDSSGTCYLAGLLNGPVQFGTTKLVGRTPGTYYSFVTRVVDPDRPLQEVELQITRSPDGLWLSWPALAIGFGLESTSSPADAASWLPLTAAPVTVGDQNSVRLDVSNGPTFYRLIKQ